MSSLSRLSDDGEPAREEAGDSLGDFVGRPRFFENLFDKIRASAIYALKWIKSKISFFDIPNSVASFLYSSQALVQLMSMA